MTAPGDPVAMTDDVPVAVTMLVVVMLKGEEEVAVAVATALDVETMVPVALAGIEILPVAVDVALTLGAEDEAEAKPVEELTLPFDEAEETMMLEEIAELDGKAEPEKLDTAVVVGPGTLNELTFDVDAGTESVALSVPLWGCQQSWGRWLGVPGLQSPHGSGKREVGMGSKEDIVKGKKLPDPVADAVAQ